MKTEHSLAVFGLVGLVGLDLMAASPFLALASGVAGGLALVVGGVFLVLAGAAMHQTEEDDDGEDPKDPEISE